MKVALVMGLALLSSLWTGGLLIKCSSCQSTVSYEDCQNNLTAINCSAGQVCFLVEARSEKGADIQVRVQKGCLNEEDCAAYSRGDHSYCNAQRRDNYTVDCKGKCCSNGDECNKENLLNPVLKCSSCSSSVSYEDCQKNLTVVDCSEPNYKCSQVETKFEKGDEVIIAVTKGCLKEDTCKAHSRGEIGECKVKKAQGYSVDCKSKCCSDGNECNKGNLLPNQVLKCSSCSSSVSYEDCQKNLTVVDCSEPNDKCSQVETKFEKGDEVIIAVTKGCLKEDLCRTYSKGDIGDCRAKKAQGFSVDCKSKCCSDRNECNKGNLLPNQGSAFVISVMVLLFSVLLTLGSVN